MERDSRIYVAGHNGMVGSAIVRGLREDGFEKLLLPERSHLDLTSQKQVDDFFESEKPAYVFLAAAKVGGILANDALPAEFIRDNLLIQTNVISAAYRSGAKKLLFLGSSCVYPKFAEQPIKESSLLTGTLESTNEWYAIAKIAGLKMCQAYRRQYGFDAISIMPTNLYGPNDNFDLKTSHVLPALISKFDAAVRAGAEDVEIWGTGNPRREFLHVDDLARASLFVMREYSGDVPLNVGWGHDISIRELAEMIGKVSGFRGRLIFDATKPDGTPRKLLDVSRLNALGWAAQIPLLDGIRQTYQWFLQAGPRSE